THELGLVRVEQWQYPGAYLIGGDLVTPPFQVPSPTVKERADYRHSDLAHVRRHQVEATVTGQTRQHLAKHAVAVPSTLLLGPLGRDLDRKVIPRLPRLLRHR